MACKMMITVSSRNYHDVLVTTWSFYQSSSLVICEVGVLAVSDIAQVANVTGAIAVLVVAGLAVAGLLIHPLSVYSSIHDAQNL